MCGYVGNHSALSYTATADHTKMAAIGRHVCFICNKELSASGHLNRHIRNVHKQKVHSQYKNLKCPLCGDDFEKRPLYEAHLGIAHDIALQYQKMTLDSYEKFLQWKQSYEQTHRVAFTTSCGGYKTSKGESSWFRCNRSGYYTPQGKGLRQLKQQGSCKINGHCPAAIMITKKLGSGEVDVCLQETHVGHRTDIQHINPASKAKIASQLLMMQIANHKKVNRKPETPSDNDDSVDNGATEVDNSVTEMDNSTTEAVNSITQVDSSMILVDSSMIQVDSSMIQVDNSVTEVDNTGTVELVFQNDTEKSEVESMKTEEVQKLIREIARCETVDDVQAVKQILDRVKPMLDNRLRKRRRKVYVKLNSAEKCIVRMDERHFFVSKKTTQ